MIAYFLFRSKRRRKQWDRLLHYNDYLSKIISIKVTGLSLLAIGILIYCAYHFTEDQSIQQDNGSISYSNRKLLSSAQIEPNVTEDTNFTLIYLTNCSSKNISTKLLGSHTPVWERCDMERATKRIGLWICLYVFITLIIFIALAIVCDDFFVPSLEAISEKLNLSEDVAGATFMAAGSSAPELFSSVAAVTFESDVGVGTITGSAVFNLLVIISLTAAFSGKQLHLDWRPLFRDSLFYAISIFWFIYSVWDTIIEAWEPVVMLILYALYIMVMVLNKRLLAFLSSIEDRIFEKKTTPEELLEDDKDCPLPSMDQRQSLTSQNHNGNTNLHDDRRSSESSQGPHRNSLSQMSRSSSCETKLFKHDRRNSVIHSIAVGRGSIKSDDKAAGLLLKRNSTKKSITKMNTLPETRTIKEDEILMEEGSQERKYSFPNHNHNYEPLVGVRKNSQDTDEEEYVEKSLVNKTLMEDPEEEEEEDECDENESEEEQDDPRMAACPWIRGAPPASPDVAGLNCCEIVMKYSVQALKWIIFILAFPFIVFFSLTIPDCSKEDNRKWFLVSFITSVLWIAGLSFGMVTVVARIGCLIQVDSYVMSLVVLAAGTSIPDLLSSIIVARDGFGDMAVSNAIGSNVFDINLGLGLPFFIRIMIGLGKPIDFFSLKERKAYCTDNMLLMPHPKFGFILLSLLILAIVGFILVRFKLNKRIGFSFFALYVLFLGYAFFQEFVCNATGRNYIC